MKVSSDLDELPTERMSQMTLAIAGVALLGMATVAPAQSLDDQLRATTQGLLDAVAPGDRSVWDAQLDPDFIHLDEAGVVHDRCGPRT